MSRSSKRPVFAILLAMVVIGGLIVANNAYQSVDIASIEVNDAGLSLDEQAYYEYVAPRLDALVDEVGATRDMVESKSRDILALTRAGTVIDTLTSEIRTYGDEHGVPAKFADVHARILSASDTVTSTFDEARNALKTFNFSGMSGLVDGFGAAADEFVAAQADLHALLNN